MLSCSRNVEIENYTLIISCRIIINVYKSNSCVIQQSLAAMGFFLATDDLAMEVEEPWRR